jgi:serine/threonine protein kinase/Tfp pilus assembly protein PilF
MGEVWRARDAALGRDVALKVLPDAFSHDPERLTRFEREARVLASLNHPNIAQIYGLERRGDTRVLVMELAEGPTLAELIGSRRPTLEECLAIARQIAEALAEAHGKGIVHRDLKPQNIKLAAGNRVKVLDFGLARRERDTSDEDTTVTGGTMSGAVLGTAGYMAPEQVRGETADARADLFAFGCVLYEMLTGQRVFRRPTTVETLAAILHEPAPRVSRTRHDLPSGLETLIARCLEKAPDRRFQSARDLGATLAALQSSAGTARSRVASVAVLPFANLSADRENEFFADGITEDVIAHLAKIKSIKVISRTSVMQFKKRDKSLREIGEALNAASLVEGSVRRAGNRVRIVAQLIDASSDDHIWAETYDRDLTDIFAIQSDVALQIANALRAELSSDESARVGRRPTADLEAYELYLRGRSAMHRFTPEGYRQALVHLGRAVARDPAFALAYASIAQVHVEQRLTGSLADAPEEPMRLARTAVARALAINDELAEAHGIAALIQFVFDFDWVAAEQAFQRALELGPGVGETHDHYSWMLASLERHDEALREVRLARDHDPLLVQSDVGTALLRAGRLEEALEESRRGAEREPGSARCHANLGWALIFLGQTADGMVSLEQAAAITPDTTMFLSQLGQAAALTGDVARARRILADLHERSAREAVSPYHFAYVYAGLGDMETALDWLDKAFEQRSGPIYGIKGSFLFRNLHGHPRFQALLERMNLA